MPTEHTALLDSEQYAESAAIQAFESLISDTDSPDDSEDIRWLREQRLQHKLTVWYKRPTVFIICFALLLSMLAQTVSMSTMVILLVDLVCRNSSSGDPSSSLTTCGDPAVQQSVSELQSQMVLCIGILSCLTCSKLSELSDIHGRKPVLIFSATVLLIAKVHLTFSLQANSFHASLFWLYGIIEGSSGGMMIFITLGGCYITDIVEPHERVTSLGFLMGAFYAGLGLGPLLGSLIIKYTGKPIITLYTGVFICILLVLLITFGIPESRSHHLRRKSHSMHLQRKASFSSQRSATQSSIFINPTPSLLDFLSPLKSLWLPKHKKFHYIPRINVLLLITVEAFLFVVSTSNTGPLLLYASANFGFNSESLGYYISLLGISKTIVLYVVAPILFHLLKKVTTTKKHALDWIDYFVLLFAASMDMLSPLLVILASSGAMIYSSGLFGSLGALGSPTITSSILKYADESKSGELLGAIAFIKTLLGMIGTPGGLFIYSASVKTYPKLVFYICLVFIVTALICAMFLRVHDEIELTDFVKPSVNDTDSLSINESDQEAISYTNGEASAPPSPIKARTYSNTVGDRRPSFAGSPRANKNVSAI